MTTMRFYRVNVAPGDGSPDGEDHAEHFGSLRDAKTRRRELIETDEPEGVDGDWSIDRIEIPKLPPRKLALLLLDGRGYVVSTEQVVAPYTAPENNEEEDDE